MADTMKKIYIFGAYSRGQTLAAYLQYLYSDISVAAYLANSEEENAERIWVYQLSAENEF